MVLGKYEPVPLGDNGEDSGRQKINAAVSKAARVLQLMAGAVHGLGFLPG